VDTEEEVADIRALLWTPLVAAHNPLVLGSNPSGPTTLLQRFLGDSGDFVPFWGATPKDSGLAGVLSDKRMVTEDERRLITRSREGDREAFAELVRLHQRMIHSLAYRMSGSLADADDLAQETFIRAFHGLPSYRATAKFASWLYRIALNVCLRWRRAELRRGAINTEWLAAAGTSDSSNYRVDRLQEALGQLAPKLRAAVILTAFEGRSHAEAADLLSCRETTVSWRLFAARRQLARLLTAPENSP